MILWGMLGLKVTNEESIRDAQEGDKTIARPGAIFYGFL